MTRYSLCRAILLLLSFSIFAQAQKTEDLNKTQNDTQENAVKLRKESFDQVWASVSVFCFDENVCGKKWDELKEKYEPRVAQVKNDNELHILLQTMLNELNTSHLRIIPTMLENITEPHLWGIGADVEIIDSQLVIKRVYQDSPAAKADLRPGFVITKINNKAIAQTIEEYNSNPLWAGRGWKNAAKELVQLYYLNGTENTEVSIEFLDEKDAPRQMTLVRSFKNQTPKLFESKMLEGGVGYIKLNVFAPTAMPEFCKTIHAMNEAPAIVLDLRDNPGGVIQMTVSMMGLLESKPVKLGRIFKITSEENSPGEEILESYPQAKPYAGKIVVLINEASKSSSEILSSSLRESGRAVIVGEPSGGEVMPSLIFKLPTPALFQLATSEFETANGVRLEGKGVVPDVKIGNGRKSLLENTDYQLQTAVNLIKEGKIFKEIKPAERQTTAPVKSANVISVKKNDFRIPFDRKIEDILEKYISAIGGKAAFEKLNSRVMSGTLKNLLTGVSGKFVMYDKMPDKSMLVVYYEDGTVQQEAFNGTDAWTFHSLLGYRKFRADMNSKTLGMSDFKPALNPALMFKQKYSQMSLVEEKYMPERNSTFNIFAVDVAETGTDLISFDKQTGLLMKKGAYEYDDYRLVDNVKIPYSIKVPNALDIALTEVKHNVEIEDKIFNEPVPNCFLMTDKNLP